MLQCTAYLQYVIQLRTCWLVYTAIRSAKKGLMAFLITRIWQAHNLIWTVATTLKSGWLLLTYTKPGYSLKEIGYKHMRRLRIDGYVHSHTY